MHHVAYAVLLISSLVGISKADLLGEQQQPLQTSKREFDSEFDAFVEETLREWHVPGLSVAVIDKDTIISKGYGYAILPDTKATADTQYFTGSTTKAFTAAAAALLVHDEKYPDLKWTSPINEFLPADFALDDPYATTHTTLEDALSHRSGLPRHDAFYGQPNDTAHSVVQRLRYLPMTAEPRTRFQYCNTMFAVVQHLVETVTGQDLESVLSKNFWKPLGMLSTTWTLPSAEDGDSRLARGYYWDPRDEQSPTSRGGYVPDPYINLAPVAGAGATISTVNDYALWTKAWLDASSGKDSVNNSSPMTHRMLRGLWNPRTIISEDEHEDTNGGLSFITPMTYALGWLSFHAADETIVGHNGGLTGFGTELFMVPARNYGIVTMGNTAETSNIAGEIIASRLLRERLNVTNVGFGKPDGSEAQLSKRNVRHTIPKNQRQKGAKRLRVQELQEESIPLPGSIEDFAGQYSHPAYGRINVTVASSPTFASGRILEVLFYPRTWPMKMQLSHLSDTVFTVKTLMPHGLGDFVSGDGIVWEDDTDEDERAVFELGINGGVELMGIELDNEMVERARGKRNWREGLIWFEKG